MMENLRYQRSVIETGRFEGHLEGFAEGRAEGRAEGVKQEKLANAKSMKALGLDVSVIAQVTGLTIDEISAL